MDKAVLLLDLSSITITNAFPAVSSSSQLYSSSFLNYSSFQLLMPRPSSRRSAKLHAKLGGDNGGGLKQPAEKKKFITREQEPEQYWQTAGEREGENPMKTPLPYIIIFGMSTPFIILAIAFANGWIKAPILR